MPALQDTIDDYGAENFRTITFDNGSEFASLNQVQGTEIYFAIHILPGNGALMRM